MNPCILKGNAGKGAASGPANPVAFSGGVRGEAREPGRSHKLMAEARQRILRRLWRHFHPEQCV